MALKAKLKTRTNKGKEEAIQEVIKEKTCRLNANVPESLYKELRIKAAQRDEKINDLVISWVKEYLT